MGDKYRKELVRNLCKCFLAASIIFSGLAITAGAFGDHHVSKQALLVPIALFIIVIFILFVHNGMRFSDWANEGYPTKRRKEK